MVQSVELLLDDALDGAVRRQWDRLAAAGLPSQARHPGASNRPHVTLTVSTVPWSAAVEAALADAVTGSLPLAVRLGAPLVFAPGPRCVLARLVVPSPALLALHARIHAAATGPREAPGGVPHTAPGEWTPHVTLARALPVARLGEAVAALSEAMPGHVPDAPGRAVGARRWDGDARRAWRLG